MLPCTNNHVPKSVNRYASLSRLILMSVDYYLWGFVYDAYNGVFPKIEFMAGRTSAISFFNENNSELIRTPGYSEGVTLTAFDYLTATVVYPTVRG